MATDAQQPMHVVADAYNTIHDAVIQTATSSSDPELVKRLLAEDKAAYAAYTSLLAANLAAADPLIKALTAQLKSAAEAIKVSTGSVTGIAATADRIDKAVGYLSRVAVLAG